MSLVVVLLDRDSPRVDGCGGRWTAKRLVNTVGHSRKPPSCQRTVPAASRGAWCTADRGALLGPPWGGRPALLLRARHDGRVKLAPAKTLGVLVRNLALSHQPVYALGEWAAPFEPALLGLVVNDAAPLNDDRVGRALALLFDADRASLLNRLVLDAVATFSIDCLQLHNDSTSVTLTGAYRDADGHRRGANRTVALVQGY